jgi:YVTN family beta-propeller protein
LESGTVVVIDTKANKAVSTITVGNIPSFVAITPNGKRAYVTNQFSNDVSVIDTATNTVIAAVSVGMTTGAIAIAPDGKQIYVAP